MAQRKNKKKSARKSRRKNSPKTSKGIWMITFVMMCLFVTLTVQRMNLVKQSTAYSQTQVTLNAKIKEARKIKKDLKEQEEYMKTPEYIKETAKEKLGLVDPDEKIFKEKDKN